MDFAVEAAAEVFAKRFDGVHCSFPQPPSPHGSSEPGTCAASAARARAQARAIS